MFERYTEKARRVIFFSRYEAAQLSSAIIDTEHLLLGILRETTSVTRLLPSGAPQAIRAQIEARSPGAPKIPTSVDLPLSDAAKRVLAYAAEEAERLKHRHIGSEHLFLGLLREKGSVAAQLLEPFGVKLEQLRIVFEDMPELSPATTAPPHRPMVTIHGSLFALKHIRDAVSRCREHDWHWRKAPWKPRDLVVNRATGRISVELSLAEDATNFEIVKGGWKKDRCSVCGWELFESEDDHGAGYTNGHHWICLECHDKFWDRPDFISGSYSEIT